MRGCSVDSDDATTVFAIHHTGGSATVEGVSILLTSTNSGVEAGILLDDSEGTVDGCTVDVSGSTVGHAGIWVFSSSSEPTITNSFITAPDGWGIYVSEASGGTIQYCTIDTTRFQGIYDEAVAMTIENCIVARSGGVGIVGASSNVSYCISPGGFSLSGGSGTGNSTDDPLFCDLAGGEYTLRVDSYGNPENNASGGRIGREDVACMYGTLARDAEYAGDGTLAMTASTTVPSSRTLILGANTVIDVTKVTPTKAQLAVSGVLDVNGADGDAVVFRSAEGSPAEGDWYGINVGTDGEAYLDYIEVRDAQYGVRYTYADGHVQNSAFHLNQTDLLIADIDGSYSVSVTGNEITVGGGVGIELVGPCDELTIDGNGITGDSGSTDGIFMWSGPGSPTVTDNTIEDFTNGNGIRFTSGSPLLTGNTVDNCKYGIRVTGSSGADIGTTSSSSDNFLVNNTNGIRCDASQASPTVRNNQIHDNTVGIFASSGGLPDVGNAGEDGENSIYDNTNFCIDNRNTASVPANGNWWGSCAAPGCTSGNVLTGGWLCSQPAAFGGVGIVPVPDAAGLRALPPLPNPTRAGSVIRFEVVEGAADVEVRIFDAAGRLVRRFPPQHFLPGVGQVSWDGRDRVGRAVHSGVYFARITANQSLTGTAKVLVAR